MGMNDDKKIVIVGAGVAGLVAAIELEKLGYAPTILEATDRVGGRVKTDYWNGYQFDHGFQVLLTAYPELKKYLDLNALNLKYFKPGATIYTGKDTFRFVDPLRQPSSFLAAIFSPAGSLSDKWKMWRLTEKLKQMSIEEIFNTPSVTTFEYLKSLGFSANIITNFFRPFFSGIFLENELATSSRLFQFIFKMFAEGYASIPEEGMQAIPDQLCAHLQNTEIRYRTSVERIAGNLISTSTGDFGFEAVIIATEPSKMLDGYQSPAKNFRSTVNMYFLIPDVSSNGYIGLISSGNTLINNLTVLSDVAPRYAPGNKSLLSVSIVGTPHIRGESLIGEVSRELTTILKLNLKEINHLRSFTISKALPDIKHPVMHLTGEQIRQGRGIYLAGDYLIGGSLNGAMVSGRQCVEFLMEDLARS
jgi:protoporphyrinogen oxidase